MVKGLNFPPFGENARYFDIKDYLTVINLVKSVEKNPELQNQYKEDILELEYSAPYLIGSIISSFTIEDFTSKYKVEMLERGNEHLLRDVSFTVESVKNNPENKFPELLHFTKLIDEARDKEIKNMK